VPLAVTMRARVRRGVMAAVINKKGGKSRPFRFHGSDRSARLTAQKCRDLELLVPLMIGEQIVGIVAWRVRRGLWLRHRLRRGARRGGHARFRCRFGAHLRRLLAAEEAPAGFLF